MNLSIECDTGCFERGLSEKEVLWMKATQINPWISLLSATQVVSSGFVRYGCWPRGKVWFRSVTCLIKIRISLIIAGRLVRFLLGQNQVHKWRIVCKVVKGKRKTKIQHWRNTERAGCGGKKYVHVSNKWNFSGRKRHPNLLVWRLRPTFRDFWSNHYYLIFWRLRPKKSTFSAEKIQNVSAVSANR